MLEERKSRLRHKLEQARQELMAVVENLSAEQWQLPAYSDEGEGWQVADVFRHLVVAEGSMIRLIGQICEGGSGVPDDFDLDRYNASMVRRNKEKGTADLFAEMSANRNELLQLVETLSEEDLQKKGRHGSMQVMTVDEILRIIALHDKVHAKDIQQTLAASGAVSG
jgi:uncharacterized damage-inducible protein DinB